MGAAPPPEAGRLRVRPAAPSDLPFLRLMLYEAATWRDDEAATIAAVEDVLARPRVSAYVEGWPRPGEAGVIAVEQARPVGGAWYRFGTADAPGYGFVDYAVPELTVGVEGPARGRGIGTLLVRSLLERARAAGVGAVSLSVEEDNPAMRLYERLGFERVARAGNAWTMMVRFGPRP